MKWCPQLGPQLEAICADWCPELLFGGSRGGGKSEFLLGDYAQGVEDYGPHWPGLLVRRSYPELQELIQRSYLHYQQAGAEWKEAKHEWHFPNRAVLRLRHLETFADAMAQQGFEYCWIGVDELGQWADSKPYFALFGSLRYSRAVVAKKRIRTTANPGGPGHQWVKSRFIDPAPAGYQILKDAAGNMRMFIPSRVQDNRILLERDPGYIERLKQVGSPELVRAWLEGDWNIVQGAYFENFTDCILKPHVIPEHWLRLRSLDWGSAKPFSCGWWAVSDGTPFEVDGKERVYPPNFMLRYREWYGMKPGQPNTGLKMTVADVAEGIRARTAERIDYDVADPSVWIEDGGPSIGEVFHNNGITWRKGDNKRPPGWQQFRDRLAGEDGRPMCGCFDTCIESIRTIPALQHDIHKPEDVDTNQEDHAADEWRMAFMSRPWVRVKIAPPDPFLPRVKTFNDLVKDITARKRHHYQRL